MKKSIAIFLIAVSAFGQGTKPPSSTLSGLSDVFISSPTNGQSLLYNSSTSKWNNGAVPAPALSSLSDVAIVSTASNQLLRWDSGSSKWVNYGPLAFTDISGSVSVAQMNGGSGASSSTYWKGDGTWGSIASAGTVIPTTNVLMGDGAGNAVDSVSSSPPLTMTANGLSSTSTANGDFLVNWFNNGTGTNATAGLRLNVADGYAEIKVLGSSASSSGILTPDDMWIRQHMNPSGPKAGNIVFSTAADQMRYSNDDGVTLRMLVGGGLSVGSATDPGNGVINAQNGFRFANAAASGKILKADGTNFVASTETYPAPGTTGNIMTSNGTNWTSSAPTSGGTVTSITATSPIKVTPDPIIATGTISLLGSVDAAWTIAQTITQSTAATNTVVNGLTLTENSTGTVANGLGTGLTFQAETSTTNSQPQASLQSAWSDVTHANKTAYFDFQLANVGSVASRMRLFGPGNLNVGNTTDPAFSTGGLITANTGFRVGTAASTSGKILKSDGTSFTASSDTFASAGSNSGKLLQSDGTNWIATTMTWPTGSAPSTGKILTSNGTNMVASTPTFPTTATPAVGKIMISDATNFVLSTPAYPNAASTLNKFIKSNGTDFVTSSVTYPDASATTNKIIKSDGTNWVASTETYAAPGTSGNVMTSDGTNWTSSTQTLVEASASAAGLTTCCASNTLIPGSVITIPTAGGWAANGQYHCVFDMTKTSAGTAAIAINIHMGTLGTTSDAIVGTVSFGAGAATADGGIFDVYVTFQSIGASAKIYMYSRLTRTDVVAGLINGTAQVQLTAGLSSAFSSTTQTKMSIGFNGGTSFSGTNNFGQSEYKQ